VFQGLKSVPEIMLLINKVKSIVTFFKRSVVAADALRESQEKAAAGEEATHQVLKLIIQK